jgi:hypothetical protein
MGDFRVDVVDRSHAASAALGFEGSQAVLQMTDAL